MTIFYLSQLSLSLVFSCDLAICNFSSENHSSRSYEFLAIEEAFKVTIGGKLLKKLWLNFSLWIKHTLEVLRKASVAEMAALKSDSFSNLAILMRSHELDLSVVCVLSAQDHALREDASRLSWLHVGKDHALALEHVLHGHVWLQARQNCSDLTIRLTKVNLLDVKLLTFGMLLTLENLADAEIALRESLELLWQIVSGGGSCSSSLWLLGGLLLLAFASRCILASFSSGLLALLTAFFALGRCSLCTISWLLLRLLFGGSCCLFLLLCRWFWLGHREVVLLVEALEWRD